MAAVQSANGFQTGLTVFPSQVAMSSSALRPVIFNALGGLLGNDGITWGVSAASKGTISAAGLYTPPTSVTGPSTDQILATATDGSQAQAFVSLIL
jgi:hypothetical protein